MMGAGLWPHFSTPASWLAAAVFAGTVYLLGSDSLRSRPLWWTGSVGIAVGLWLVRAGTSLVVRPEQLLPMVERAGVSPALLVFSVLTSVATVWGLHRFRRIVPNRRAQQRACTKASELTNQEKASLTSLRR